MADRYGIEALGGIVKRQYPKTVGDAMKNRKWKKGKFRKGA